MKYPLVGKAMALCAVTVTLIIGLHAVAGIVGERQERQREAEQSVVDGLAGSQTVLGPAVQRRCVEEWENVVGEGKERRTVTERREFSLTAWPRSLRVVAAADIQPRYRGLFKLNGYLAKTKVVANWTDLAVLRPAPEHAGGKLACEAPTVSLAVSDARGIQSATVQAGAQTLTVGAGSLMRAAPLGIHASLDESIVLAAPLDVEIGLELVGTRSMAWVPVGGDTLVQLSSNWPHPSFGGRFLPARRDVSEQGFQSQWQISALATSAQQISQNSLGFCSYGDLSTGGDTESQAARRSCVDSFGVSFIDPINSYVLSDRALKYGLLFVVLTFLAVALVEVMRRVRVHPVQYLLVGCALVVFFLLLVSLSEHLVFRWAYLSAAGACCALLSFYAKHILGGALAGVVFGAGNAMLFGALYVLLQMEQAALVLGSLLMFAALTAVMVVTRRVDWYALNVQLRGAAPGVDGTADEGTVGTIPA